MGSIMSDTDKDTSFLTQNEGHQTHELMPENTDNGSKKFGENADPELVNMNYQEVSTLGQVVGNEDNELIPKNTENGCKKSGENVDPEHADMNYQEINTLGQVAGNPDNEFILENTEKGGIETAVNVEFEDVIINVDVNCEDISFLAPDAGDQTHETHDSKLENMDIGEKTDASDKIEEMNLSEKEDVNIEVAKSGRTSARKGKMVAHKKSKKYPLRSSLGSNRVLRSRSTTSKPQPESVNTPVNPVTKAKKRKRTVKQVSNDEFLLMRKRVRYLLTRMSYEQILIDSYSSDGWKGQSAEKLRPEKEIERAKSEILRCKCKIREIFQRIDSLSSEGRFDESLFDAEGEIDHEDIFCSKCGSKDSSLDNDILLCDGICDRGFHQMCVNPPLLSADIPQGDEGWLCPVCDCKVDCIDLVNDTHGSDIAIEDPWEKVFPEAVAVASGDKQFDDLPSDDSEDDDYNPDGLADDDVKNQNDASEPEDPDSSHNNKKMAVAGGDKQFDDLPSDDSEDDDYNPDGLADDDAKNQNDASEPEDSDSSHNNIKMENFGFPSDGSEDDEFDPDAVNLDNSKMDSSSSNESDFTSDSDEFSVELSKTAGANKGKGTKSKLGSALDSDLKLENVLESGRRQVERLDYKTLYDETYKNSFSGSSDDEDWTASNRKKKTNKKESKEQSKPDSQIINKRKNSKTVEGTDASQGPNSSGRKSSASGHGKLSEDVRKKLYESFQENQYPKREAKEKLAQELGITYRQVEKWFGNCRHSIKHYGEKATPTKVSSSNQDKNSTKKKTIRESKGKSKEKEIQEEVTEGSTCSSSKRKHKNVETKPENKDGDDLNDVDMDRDKAIARELKRMVKGKKVR